MTHLKNSEKYILLNNLFNLYIEARYNIEDEEFLRAEGIDIEAIVKKNMMLYRQLNTIAKSELNDTKYNRVKEFLFEFKTGIANGIEVYQRMADEIFAKPKFVELQPMFRNLTEITEKDKKSILIDSKLLELLSEIEEKYNEQLNNE